jgi:hypothetical protein
MKQSVGAQRIDGIEVRPYNVPLVVRCLGKFVLEVLPAAAASVIGALVLAQYQFGHTVAPAPAVERASPASVEMLQLIRDEHAAILKFLTAQRGAEEIRLASSADDSAPMDTKPAPTRREAASVTVKPATPRTATRRAAAVAAVPPRAPLVIARLDADHNATLNKPTMSPSNPIIARSLAIKDGVFSATWHVVSAIGGFPSWIASRDRPTPGA